MGGEKKRMVLGFRSLFDGILTIDWVPFLSDSNFLRKSVTFVKKCCHVGILKSDNHWTMASSMKG
jgi:hypothetical protein